MLQARIAISDAMPSFYFRFPSAFHTFLQPYNPVICPLQFHFYIHLGRRWVSSKVVNLKHHVQETKFMGARHETVDVQMRLRLRLPG